MPRRFLWTLLKYALGLGILGWVIWSNWAPEGRPGLSDIDPWTIAPEFLALAWGCILFAVSCTFVRWYFLVRAQDLPFTVSEAFRLGLMGYAIGTLLPSTVGGDILKAATLARGQSRRTVAVATVVVDRILGTTGLFWFVTLVGGVYWALGWLEHDILWYVVLVAFVITVGSLALWVGVVCIPRRWSELFADRLSKAPKVGPMLAELWRTLHMYRLRGRSMFVGLLLSMLGHCVTVFGFYFCVKGLFPNTPPPAIPPLQAHALLVPVGTATQATFPTPGGVGGAELAFEKLYEQLGGDGAKGVSMAFLQRVVSYSVAFVGYLVFLWMRPTFPAITVAESKTDSP